MVFAYDTFLCFQFHNDDSMSFRSKVFCFNTNLLVQILIWSRWIFQQRLVHKLLQLLFKKSKTQKTIFWKLMKNTTRKYKFNKPQIVKVENMANQISRKKIFKKIIF